MTLGNKQKAQFRLQELQAKEAQGQIDEKESDKLCRYRTLLSPPKTPEKKQEELRNELYFKNLQKFWNCMQYEYLKRERMIQGFWEKLLEN